MVSKHVFHHHVHHISLWGTKLSNQLRLDGEAVGRLRLLILLHLRLDLSSVPGSPLPGQVGQRAMARSLELTVRHLDSLECCRKFVEREGWVR